MSKKYSYTRGERQAERELDRFLAQVRQRTPLPTTSVSVIDELRALAADS